MDESMNYKIAAHTDVGINKSTNQDSVLIKVAQTDFGNVVLATVCDGMGGLAKGELASATLIRMLAKWFEEELPKLLYQGISIEKLKQSWTDLIYRANDKISSYSRALHTNMGTTMTLLLMVDNLYYIANVGDSRIYYLREEITQLTKDQTVVQREVDRGNLTPQEAKVDKRRNVLLQCIGASQYIEPDFYTGKVNPGSMFLLCSDGFRHEISEEEMYGYLTPFKLLNEQAMKDSLVYLTDLNKYRMEKDNISAALIRTD